MLQKDLSLLMFAGGDGTARDIYSAGGTEIPALGIPAGVKIHSAVYAIHPRAAGELAAAYLQSKVELILAEVVDLDEEAYRQGSVSTRLYGYIRIPYVKRYIQGVKVSSTMVSSACLNSSLKSSGTSPNLFSTTASENSPTFGSPVRLNATAPALARIP